MWITIGVIIVIIAIAYLVLNYYPPLGGKASPESIRRMEESPNRSKGKFLNEIPTDMSMNMRETGKVLIDFVKGNPKGKPKTPIPIVRLTAEQLQSDGRHAKVTWFGHSAVLVRIDGKTIFIDPMLGRTPSPVPIFGGKDTA